MTVLALCFPWRRYHATPWGHHVNEGAVELPPSPWRILRALYSVWRLRAPHLETETVHGLLSRLAVPPEYVLPPYRLSHTRHYLPDSRHMRGKSGGTDLAVDAFAELGGDATIYLRWPFDLDPEQDKALETLAGSLPYLGRADSLCDAHVERAWQPPETGHALPLNLDAEVPPGHLQADLLTPTLPLNLDGLTSRPVDIRAGKLLYPPGSQLVPYSVPPPAPAHEGHVSRTAPSAKATVVRLALTGSPQPRMAEAVTVTDALRAACIKAISPKDDQPTSRVLIGKDPSGTPLTGPHEHAHYLALPAPDGIHIAELAIWAKAGISDADLAALTKLNTRTIGVPKDMRGPRDLNVRISAYGGCDLLPGTLTGPATTWRSVTPFVPTRYRPRHRPIPDYLAEEVGRELAARGLTAAIRVTDLREPHWALHTRTRWSRRPTTPTARTDTRPVFGLLLEFPKPITGPLTLGTLSHFGLGLFTPA